MPPTSTYADEALHSPRNQEASGSALVDDEDVIEISSDESDASPDRTYLPPNSTNRGRTAAATKSSGRNRIKRVISSSEEIIELDSSPERDPPPARNKSQPSASTRPPLESAADDAFLYLNDPPGSHKPFRLPGAPATPRAARLKEPAPSTPKSRVLDLKSDDLDNESVTNVGTPSKITPAKAKRTPRQPTKKARAEADFQHRKEYAQSLFVELNKQVFGDRLPSNTQLVWNKRLLTTAGRAKFLRSNDKPESSSIELADKILDCEERIRNTLSHEMCHLACWIIDEDITEQHGRLFKSWTHRVMKYRPEITIDTRHSYEIKYKYEWRCDVEACGRVYGRFTKSINPEACVCGVCKVGKLQPMFTTRKRATPAKPSGLQGLNKSLDSSRSRLETPVPLVDLDELSNESDSDVQILADAFGKIVTI